MDLLFILIGAGLAIFVIFVSFKSIGAGIAAKSELNRQKDKLKSDEIEEEEEEILEEEELNGNEKGLSSNTFNQIDDVLFEIDKFKNIKFLNTAATKKFGKKLQGKHIATVLRVPEILQNIDVVLSTSIF